MQGQSPHGDSLKIDCSVCHDPSGWKLKKNLDLFNHNATAFALEGRHISIDCKDCHRSLVFSETSSQCSSCHSDVHQMTLGNDCSRCHTSVDWGVNQVTDLHAENGFALIGAHQGLSCVDCHKSETNLKFDRIGNDCTNCHMNDFLSAKNPDHSQAGFSTNCIECHDPISNNWSSENFNHDFFPLTSGHDISDCKLCHHTNNFSDASSECSSCHLQDFANTANPDHTNLDFSTACTECHTSDSWSPSTFDHSTYPFIGKHMAIANDCNSCHHNNYNNTPNTCGGCHMLDYTATTNPEHSSAHFPTDCAECHTEFGWTPSSFDHSSFPPYRRSRCYFRL